MPCGCVRTHDSCYLGLSYKYRSWRVSFSPCIGCLLKYPIDLHRYKLTPTQTSFRYAKKPFYLCLSSSMIDHNWPIGQSNGAQVFTLAVPGLSLFVVCSSIWMVKKYLSFMLVSCLELFFYFSVTSGSGLIWRLWLWAVFSYLTKQVFAYFSGVWICLAWVAIAGIFSHSAHCFSIPPARPVSPQHVLSSSSSFPSLFPSILSLASTAVCLPAALRSTEN